MAKRTRKTYEKFKLTGTVESMRRSDFGEVDLVLSLSGEHYDVDTDRMARRISAQVPLLLQDYMADLIKLGDKVEIQISIGPFKRDAK